MRISFCRLCLYSPSSSLLWLCTVTCVLETALSFGPPAAAGFVVVHQRQRCSSFSSSHAFGAAPHRQSSEQMIALAAAAAAASNTSNDNGNEKDNQLSEVERLLQKARELKAQAEAEERALHETLLTQKEIRDQQLDKCVDDLFPTLSNTINSNEDLDARATDCVDALVTRMKELQYSTDKLLEIVVRLHEREIKAKGIHHVEAHFQHNTHTGFQRVSTKQDEDELERVTKMIYCLIKAAEQIDEEYLSEKRNSKDPSYLTHVDIEHWTVGECGAILSTKIRELRREHEEQFQERLHSFYKAQRKKDLPPPPEYMP